MLGNICFGQRGRHPDSAPEMPQVRLPRLERALGAGLALILPGIPSLIGDTEEKTGKRDKRTGLDLIG